MHSSNDEIPQWLAKLSDRLLRRLYSRISYLLKVIDAELQIRDARNSKTISSNNQ